MQLARPLKLAAIAGVFSSAILGAVVVHGNGVAASQASTLALLDRSHIYGPRARWYWAAVQLAYSSPSRAARKALAAGDRRLLGTAGIAAAIPGTEFPGYARHLQANGFRLLAEGCVTYSPEERQYGEAAYQYAVAYNRTMLAESAGAR